MDKITRRKIIKAAAVAAGSSLIKPISLGIAQTQGELPPFNIGINALVTSLDPHHVAGSIVGNRVYNFIFDQLTQIDSQGKVRPMLATGWRNDGLIWRFTLRQGVRFHDGTTMTARDAAYSLNRLLFSNRESAIRASFAPIIEKVEASGNNTLVITTKRPEPLLPLRLATPNACIMPQTATEQLGFDKVQTAPVGAGPFKVVEISANRVVLEAHDRYWGGRPNVSRVTLRLIPENATRLAALQSGEVDFITTVPPDLIQTIEGTRGLKVDSARLYNYMLIYFNTKKGLTANVNLRRALSLSIDRETITKALWGGRVRVMNDYFLPGELAWDQRRPNFPFDLEAARAALKQSGYNNEPLEFTPPSTYYTNGRVVTDAIAEMWKTLGVNVQYTPLEFAQWAQRSLAGNNVATLQSFGTLGDPATATVTQEYTSTAWISQYYSGNDEYRRLVAEAASSTQATVRVRNYRQIKAILDRDVPIAPLYQTVEFSGTKDGVSWQPHPNFYIDLRPDKFSFRRA